MLHLIGKNSKSTLLDLLSFNDVLFIQEHWLFQEKLHVLSNFHNDFTAVGVSGMDSYCMGDHMVVVEF